MRIRSITPIRVDADELERRQQRYERMLPVGWTLDLENIPATVGTPDQLSSPDQIRASERVGVEAGRDTDAARFDALLPDCVLDPGVAELDELAGVPVLGITRLTAHFLAACGQRFGVITRNHVIGDEYRSVIERYGLAKHFDDVYVLGLSVDDIANDEIWNESIERVARTAAKNGTTVLINGCSAVDVTVAGGSVRIVDPTALAFQVAELATRLDLVS
jgi:Hydantoin racemase